MRSAKVAGIVMILALGSGCSMKSMMVQERVSPYDVDTTVQRIRDNAKSIGWVAPEVKDMNKSILKNGGKDIGGPVRIVELCNAGHAGRILSDDEGRYSALLMPLLHAPGAAIEISTGSAGGNGSGTGTSWVTVRDFGRGVAPELRQRIFDRFARGSGATAGTGLGLAIARSIAEAHGGTLTLDPVDRCAAFTLRLPAPTT